MFNAPEPVILRLAVHLNNVFNLFPQTSVDGDEATGYNLFRRIAWTTIASDSEWRKPRHSWVSIEHFGGNSPFAIIGSGVLTAIETNNRFGQIPPELNE